MAHALAFRLVRRPDCFLPEDAAQVLGALKVADVAEPFVGAVVNNCRPAIAIVLLKLVQPLYDKAEVNAVIPDSRNVFGQIGECAEGG